ncbi:MAG TPA: TonB-dependent receptor [Steroidobacteraceae bacterium]
MKIKTIGLVIGCLGSWLSDTAGAQTTSGAAASADSALQEIIVTATKTGPQDLQKTAVAVSVVGGGLLQDQALNNLQDIASYIPNMSYSRNVTTSIISLRGIGSSGGASVTTQIDGVYIASDSGLMTDFLDVARVEVLRGPQGTLYGRNATGGTINIVSQTPSPEFTGRVEVTAGNFHDLEGAAYVSGPIAGDAVTASLSVDYRHHDPYFENIAPGGHGVDGGGIGGARLQVRVAPVENVVATTRADYSSANQYFESYDHLLARIPFAPRASSVVGDYGPVAINAAQILRTWIGGVSEDIEWSIADRWNLRSISAWRSTKTRAFNDNDGTELDLLYYKSTEDNQQTSQEFDLNYKGDRLTGVLGLYYFSDDGAPGSLVRIPPSLITPPAASAYHGAFPDLTTRSVAIFGQGEYEILPGLKIIAGARYTTEKNAMSQDYTTTSLNPATLGAIPRGFPIMFDVDRRDNAFTPKFGLDYQASENVFLYGSATRGFKSGGFNTGATSSATSGFAPELIWSYEGGAKTEWFDRRLRVNLTGFYYNYTNLQVRQLLGPGNAVIGNAASAVVKGVELESILKPIRELQISANVAVLSAKYDSFPTAAIAGGFSKYVPDQNCVAGVCTIDASGKYLNDAPKVSGMVAIDYSPQIGNYNLTTHVDYAYRSATYFDTSNIPISSQRSYGLVNANLGFGPADKKGWEIQPYAKNITNRQYYLTISGNGAVPGAIVGDPRTYGVRLNYHW